jgi:hypothetical protein
MSQMLLRIKLFFHVLNLLVYPIFSKHLFNNFASLQEGNDQAFSVSC